MKVKLEQTTKYYCTQEAEAKKIIEDTKEKTDGDITKQVIDRKNHGDYGDYYEVTVKEFYTTSKQVLGG